MAVVIRTATLSTDGRYRYRLGRRWDAGPTLPWIMLNPSAADDSCDDPTTRRVVSFSRSWGFGACVVVNLFAFRCANPGQLGVTGDPIGRRNTRSVIEAIDDAASSGADRIVVGWGVHGHRWLASDNVVGNQLRRSAASAAERWTERAMRPVTLGATTGGAPRHPLYVRSSTALQPLSDAMVTATR